ncbi:MULTISPECIES: hypothetical protein [Rhizobium]|uniref:hypothetical protein n=1 Tax=Rhizobium TaxID=379 RepID=UPI001FF14E24|nr:MULTISPECIES: hypothetical protein [Rhizobium]
MAPFAPIKGGQDVFHLQSLFIYGGLRRLLIQGFHPGELRRHHQFNFERLVMVVIITTGTPTKRDENWRLRSILKRADYATIDLVASEHGDHHEEVMVIRRIKAATIPAPAYPSSRRRKLHADPEALASWENEGGATRDVDAPADKKN